MMYKIINTNCGKSAPLARNIDTTAINIRPDSLDEPDTSLFNENPALTAISLDETVDQVTHAIMNSIPPSTLFNVGGEICRVVTDNQSEYGIRLEPLGAVAFRTWISQYATFFKEGKGGPKVTSIDKGTAEAVLGSPIFKDNLPIIEQLCTRQLPYGVRGNDGKWIFTPTSQGYDKHTRTYTVDTNPIDWENPMPVDEAVAFINHQFSECRFDNGIKNQEESTGMAIVVATMLGQFLRLNISRFPICIAEANRPGAGKTFLVQAMLAPFYGDVSSESFPKGEDKQQRAIVAHARAGKGYCFFDNVQELRSNAVEQAVTSGSISYSKFYTQDTAVVRNRMQFLITGNGLVTREDTDRRARRIMLLKNSVGHDHTYAGIISAKTISTPEWQRQMLAALWGLVHGWVNEGCPDMGGKHLASFDDWRKLAANIAIWAGWTDPCVEQQGRGDSSENAFLEVLQQVAAGMPAYGQPCKLTMDQVLLKAHDLHYTTDILNGRASDKLEYYCQQYKNKCLGVHMQDARGREFWLQENRPSVNGVRLPRELRVYFAELDPYYAKLRQQGVKDLTLHALENETPGYSIPAEDVYHARQGHKS